MGRMNASCNSLERLSLGAYVLGALDPVERAAVDAHLAGCPACRDELAGLAAMPGLLSRVRVEDVLEPAPSPTPAAADRLIGRLRAARRARRRRLGAAAGAVALAAIAGAIVIGTYNTGGSGASKDVASISASDARTGVTASFGVRPAPWGTAVRVRLRGVPPNTRCKLIAYSRGGGREVAGTWRATYDGTADVQTATAIPRGRLAAFEVATAGGHRLVRAAL
jgi:Putative zinc-finger